MEAEYRIDLDYITERIITVSFSKAVPDQIYIKNLQDITQMIKSKHGHNYMVINLSEKNASLTQMNPEVLDTGWLDGLAPSLEQMCDVCKTMENWLQSHTKHVLVIHCQGGQGRVGVLVATYIHFSCLSDSADLALDHFAMRKFYNDKVSSLMSPSQKRYVWMFSSLLKGVMKMNPSPLFLPCVLLHGVPVLTPEGGRISERNPLVQYKISFQTHTQHTVYRYTTLSVALPTDLSVFPFVSVCRSPQIRSLSALVQVVCYNKNPEAASREVIFRLQFHTGVIHGHPMLFPKQELDIANKGIVTPVTLVGVSLIVSTWFFPLPEGIGCWKNGPSVMIDYDTLDPLIRRDSYENISPDGKDLPLSPVDARLYVRKRSTDEGGALFPPASSGPNPVDLNMSTSSDSGLSIASQWNGANPRRGPSQDKCTQPRRVLSEVNPEPAQCLPKDMAELPGSSNGGEGLVGEGQRIKGEPLPSERETDILDDYEASHKATLALGRPRTQRLVQSGRTYSTKTTHTTQSWIQQQQMVDAHPQTYPHTDEEELTDRRRLISPPISQEAMSFPATPSRGSSSREAVLRVVVGGVGGGELLVPNDTDTKEELALLATDMDESIEQLNQLILDLDPTFIPVPTRHHPLHLSCSASLYANGTSQMTTHPNGSQSDFGYFQIVFCNGCLCMYVGGAVTTSQSLPLLLSQTPPPVWSDRTPTSVSSPFHLRSFPSQSPLSLPNAHSSPQWPSRSPEVPGGQSQGERSEGDQRQENSLLLGNWGLERSLLEAMEGLDLGLDLGLAEDRLGGLPPLLPEKRVLGLGQAGSRSPSLSGFSSPLSGSCLSIPFPSASTPDPLRGPSTADTFASKQDTVKFVQDTSKFWYKPDISRDQAIVVLKDREPGSFIVRDSHSFRGAYGLAMKVSSPPPSVLTQSKKVSGDLSNELVRHFLIECTQKGVRLKGCPNEPYFGSLTALVCQHAITPLALPCKLIIPGRDPLEETSESSTQTATNSAADLLKQGAACNVWFLGSVELESLTGYQAVQKAASQMLAMDPPPTSTVVHFKVSTQGITLTDNQRKLFFRRHYNVNTVIFCALDPQDRKWTKDGCTSAKIFGFVARKSMSGAENVCHVFAEHDPEQPASAIVNFVSKVMIGSTKK
uniref:Tensin 3 n=1 Tax=Esox lucius TaxID=8010 RepID=A0A3P8X7I3_ESOLU